MIIYSDLNTSNAINQLRLHGRETMTSMQRLSSGLRINNAADDPSGLAIVNVYRARLGGLNTAVANLQDGINMLRTAEATIQEVSDMAMRIRDLCVRGANDATITQSDRDHMQAEIDSLIDGINQIGEQTTYNTKHVNCDNDNYAPLSTDLAAVNDNHSGAGTPIPGDPEYDALVANIKNVVTAAIEKVYGMLGVTPDPAMTLDINFMDIDGNGDVLAQGGVAGGNMIINIDLEDFLESYDLDPAGARVGYDPSKAFTMEQVIAHEMTHAVFMTIGGWGGAVWGQEMLATMVSGEVDRRIQSNEDDVKNLINGVGLTSGAASSDEYAEVGMAGKFIVENFGAGRLREICQHVIDGDNFDTAIETVLEDFYDDFAEFEEACDAWCIEYIDSGRHESIGKEGMGWTTSQPNEVQSNAWYLQIGADNSENQRTDVFTPWSMAGSFDYLPFVSVSNQQAAQNSLATMNRVIAALGNAQSLIGRQDRVFNHAIDDLETEIINLEASKSKLLDTDMAAEATSLTRENILTAGASSALRGATEIARAVLDMITKHLG